MSDSDPYAERRREILGKLRWNEKFYFRKLPQRKEAVLREDPRHNPLILEECPRCRGYGKESIYNEPSPERPWSHALISCPECCGLGMTGNAVRYFSEDPPPVDAMTRPDGWLRCPGCSRAFCTRDEVRWTGMRHTTCGQRINLLQPPTVAADDSAEQIRTEESGQPARPRRYYCSPECRAA